MKRVVVQVNPDEEENTEDGTKVETVLSDDSAQMLLTTVLDLNGKQSPESSEHIIEFLVRREIKDSDDSTERGLFDRLMTRVERSLLSTVFAECDHVQTRTACRLGIDRNTLHKKLSKYKLLNSEQRESA